MPEKNGIFLSTVIKTLILLKTGLPSLKVPFATSESNSSCSDRPLDLRSISKLTMPSRPGLSGPASGRNFSIFISLSLTSRFRSWLPMTSPMVPFVKNFPPATPASNLFTSTSPLLSSATRSTASRGLFINGSESVLPLYRVM